MLDKVATCAAIVVDEFNASRPQCRLTAALDRLVRPRFVRPGCPLQNCSVSIVVSECPAPDSPVRVEGLHGHEASVHHCIASLLPGFIFGDVEHEQILDRWGRAHVVLGSMNELEVVTGRWMAHHDSVEAVVVIELAKHIETQAATVHFGRSRRIRYRTGDP